jgi:hypothetical protein
VLSRCSANNKSFGTAPLSYRNFKINIKHNFKKKSEISSIPYVVYAIMKHLDTCSLRWFIHSSKLLHLLVSMLYKSTAPKAERECVSGFTQCSSFYNLKSDKTENPLLPYTISTINLATTTVAILLQ